MQRAWPVLVAGALLAPLVTWLPMLAAQYPSLGLPRYQGGQGIDLWQMQTFWLVTLGSIAALALTKDRWMGVALLVGALTVFVRGAAMDPTHTVLFALGALLLIGAREIPSRYHQRIRWLIVISACIQAAYMAHQWAGYDLLWGPLLGGTLAPTIQMLGTLGSVNAAAGYVAIAIPLMPLGLAIPAAAVVLASHSLGAVAAMLVGVAWCFRGPTLRTRVLTSVIALAGLIGAAFMLRKATQGARAQIWQFGLEHWAQSNIALGWGLGGWSQRVPALQQQHAFSPTGEYWAQAHNEPVQWLTETGLVGAVLLGLWLWSHRAMISDPVWGGSVAALAMNTLGWHTLHIVSTALLAIIVVGIASRPQEERACCAAA